MVGYNVDHNPDIHIVSSFNEVLKALFSTKVVVDLVPVSSPVSMETIVSVIDNWRDPDSVESEILDVLEIVDDSLEITATVVWLTAQIAR